MWRGAAIVVDGEVHGRMTPRQTRRIAEKLLASPKRERAPVARPKPAAPVRGKTFLDRCCDECKNREGTPCPNFLLCRLEDVSCHEDAACSKYRSELRDLALHTSPNTVAQIFLCKGLTCDAGNESGIYTAFRTELKRRDLLERVEFVETGCQGLCEVGPIVQLKPLPAFYCRVKPADVAEIVQKHIVGKQIVERLLYAPGQVTEADIPFYQQQERRVLSNTGKIDPKTSTSTSPAAGTGRCTGRSRRMTPEKIVEVVIAAGLRGRGGGGFPTGRSGHRAHAVSSRAYVGVQR